MCQNQGQAIYTRSATTRIVAIKLDMPNPFFALALGLCTQANSYQGEMGAGTTSFHFKRLYRPRSRSGRSRQELKENIRPYYLVPDSKVGHDAFAVIRETIRNMDMVAIGRVVLTSREHIIALEPLDNGLMGTLLRYPYEVRDEKEYFDDIQDVKVTKDMLDLAKHIVTQKAADFEPEKFEDHYEEAWTELINAKRNGQTISAK